MPKEVRRGGLVIPRAEPPEMPEEITITDPVIVGADWHIPHHDADMIGLLCEIAVRDKIDHLIMNGDFMTLDAYWMGGYFKKPNTMAYVRETEKGYEMFEALLRVFKRITYVSGNHEGRLYRLTNGEQGLKSILADIFDDADDPTLRRRVKYTDRDYVWVQHGPRRQDLWRVTHGVGGSVSHAANAAISKVDSYDCNVLQGHNHLWGAKQSKNGLYLGVDTGCLIDPNLAEYKMVTTKTFPQWRRGFSTIKNGKVRPYSDVFTDWDSELPGSRYWPRLKARMGL